MTLPATTLGRLLAALEHQDPETPLVFNTDVGTIGAGYHVTELKQADITSIDCGRQVTRWQEAVLQLLDGKAGEHMCVGKFVQIMRQSQTALEGLDNLPFAIEFAHENHGLRRYVPGAVGAGNDAVTVQLRDDVAACKPAKRPSAAFVTSCCGVGDIPNVPTIPEGTTGCCGLGG